jgi:hypothetical protein
MNASVPKPPKARPLTGPELELRNIYAGLALPSVITLTDGVMSRPSIIADNAFSIADAMLERSRK